MGRSRWCMPARRTDGGRRGRKRAMPNSNRFTDLLAHPLWCMGISIGPLYVLFQESRVFREGSLRLRAASACHMMAMFAHPTCCWTIQNHRCVAWSMTSTGRFRLSLPAVSLTRIGLRRPSPAAVRGCRREWIWAAEHSASHGVETGTDLWPSTLALRLPGRSRYPFALR